VRGTDLLAVSDRQGCRKADHGWAPHTPLCAAPFSF